VFKQGFTSSLQSDNIPYFTMKIKQIPVLSDNLSYLIIDEVNNVAGVVDPAEPDKIINAIQTENAKFTLTHLLTTHHHSDHSGGNVEMKKRFPELEVIGSEADRERIPAITKGVKDNDTFKIGDIHITVLFAPCHTRGHMLYLVKDEKDPASKLALFTGDTIFIAGCGRFFEGDAIQMLSNMDRVAKLPKDTEIYCGHEYTVKNLLFAKTIEPQNEAILKKLEWAQNQRAKEMSTIPSTLEQELATNPFMRIREPSVQNVIGESDPVKVMAELRSRKDKF